MLRIQIYLHAERNAMSTKKILHFGLNRSGTNYLHELLQQTFDIEVLNTVESRKHPLHKHFRLYNDKTKIGRPNYHNTLSFKSFKEFEERSLKGQKVDLYVIISKDPYSWHLSYTNWGRKHDWPESPHPYIFEYNEYYKKWWEFSLETSRIVFVKYLDLLTEKERILNRIQKDYNLDLIKDIDQIKTIRKVPMSKRFTNKKNRYYLERKYLLELSPSELKDLNNNIDHELIQNLGYEIYE
jgi:hypothetical protein